MDFSHTRITYTGNSLISRPQNCTGLRSIEVHFSCTGSWNLILQNCPSVSFLFVLDLQGVYVRTVFLHRLVEVEHTHITYILENIRSCMLSRCMLSVIFLHRFMKFVHSQLDSVYLCMLARLLPFRLCMLNMYVLNIHGLTYTKRP